MDFIGGESYWILTSCQAHRGQPQDGEREGVGEEGVGREKDWILTSCQPHRVTSGRRERGGGGGGRDTERMDFNVLPTAQGHLTKKREGRKRERERRVIGFNILWGGGGGGGEEERETETER